MTIFLDYQADPAAFQAALEDEVITAALCLEMQFASGTAYASNWNVDFVADGKTWRGLGDLVGLSEIGGGSDDLTPLVEYTLAIPAELLTANEKLQDELGRIPELMGNPAEYKGRLAILSCQAFVNGQPLGSPFVLHSGFIEKPHISAAAGRPVVLRIQSESILIGKRRPPAGKLTERDQKYRHPTDKGLDFVPNAASEQVDWLNS